MNKLSVVEADSQLAKDEMNVEIELSALELAYVGGGIGDVVGH